MEENIVKIENIKPQRPNDQIIPRKVLIKTASIKSQSFYRYSKSFKNKI